MLQYLRNLLYPAAWRSLSASLRPPGLLGIGINISDETLLMITNIRDFYVSLAKVATNCCYFKGHKEENSLSKEMSSPQSKALNNTVNRVKASAMPIELALHVKMPECWYGNSSSLAASRMGASPLPALTKDTAPMSTRTFICRRAITPISARGVREDYCFVADFISREALGISIR